MQLRFGLDESWFPQPVRWVHTRRSDTIAQAVSMVRAEQTGRWVSNNAHNSDAPTAEFPAYEPSVLLDVFHGLRRDEENWKSYFKQRLIKPVEVVYEDLADDYEATIRAVATALGERVEVIEPPQIARQADSLNAAWASRLIDDFPELDVTDRGR
jgi:trehalose 2-sulfotransferase